MRNIPYSFDWGLDLPQEVQLQRVLRVMEQELTEKQRETLTAYYFEELSPKEIAQRQGVHISTVLRSIRRGEDRLRRHLTY